MKKVFQTATSGGNCFACCVASLLELNAEDVPNFHKDHQEAWVIPFRDWLRQFKVFPLTCLIEKSDPFLERFIADCGSVYIAGGLSERGTSHACVYEGDELLHDPHPDGEGLNIIEDMTFLVPIRFLLTCAG